MVRTHSIAGHLLNIELTSDRRVLSPPSPSSLSSLYSVSNLFPCILCSSNIHCFLPGAYGTVYKARDTLSDKIVAIKKVKLALTEDGVPMSVLREISLLKQLGKSNHPNIVRY